MSWQTDIDVAQVKAGVADPALEQLADGPAKLLLAALAVAVEGNALRQPPADARLIIEPKESA